MAQPAKATQNANLVRQKAYNAVYGAGTGTTSDSISPGHFYGVKAFFLHMAANKGNPDLQFIPFGSAGTNNAVVEGVSGAATLYALFAFKTSTTTASYVKVSDDATSIVADSPVILKLGASESVLSVYPDGKAFATGVIVSSTTSYNGTNNSTTDGNGNAAVNADRAKGFVIVG
jgi:hypothetical protein